VFIRVHPWFKLWMKEKITKRTDFLLFALSAAFRIAFWLFDG